MDFENFEKIFHHRNKLEPQKHNIPENNSPENLKKFLTILRILLKIQLQISILDPFWWVTECLPPTGGKY